MFLKLAVTTSSDLIDERYSQECSFAPVFSTVW